MTDNLNDIWRSAKMWPEDAASFFEHLNAKREASQSVRVSIDWDVVNLNMTASSARLDSTPFESVYSDMVAKLCRTPDQGIAKSVYDLIVSCCSLGAYVEGKITTQFLQEESQRQVAASFLLFVIQYSPHKVAILNAMKLFHSIGSTIEADILQAFSGDPDLATSVYKLIGKTKLSERDKQGLIFTTAKAGSFNAQEHLFNTLSPESPPEVRHFVLRHAQFAVLPPDETYIGFDVGYNPEFLEGILAFVKRTQLLSELNESKIDDELIASALEVFSNLSICLREDIEWGNIGDPAEMNNMLYRLVDHLEQRELSISAMFDLAFMFEVMFSDTYYWLKDDPNKKISDADLIVSRESDYQLATKILDVFDCAPNRRLLDAALSSMGNKDYYSAMLIILRTSGGNSFDTIYGYIKNELPRVYTVHVDYAVLGMMFAAIGFKTEKAEKAANWCIDYCRFERHGGYIPAPGNEIIMKGILPVIKSFPGVGTSLITAGLDVQSPVRKLAAETLLAWPTEFWPPRLLWRLDSAIKKEEHTLDLLNTARGRLGDNLE